MTSAFTDINTFGKIGFAERDVYPDFLGEAAVILERPALTDVAELFRKSAQAWDVLSLALLPDEVEILKETRQLMLQKRDLFLNQGNGGMAEMGAIDGRLVELKTAVSTNFPLDEAGMTALKENIAAHVVQVYDIEQEAVAALQAAMA
ncbi:MAG: hypothetical protein GWP17_06600 [Aquificales bacterium]|nr:hypothetical protein [Aquificales bacterium]